MLISQASAEALQQSASESLTRGYLFAALAIVLLILGVGLSLYLDRRKKQRQANQRDNP